MTISRYDPQTRRCLGGKSMALRDQKKDLDVLQKPSYRKAWAAKLGIES